MASTSVYRQQLLSRFQLKFEVESPGVDEMPATGETPIDLAARLARQKAGAVAARHPDAWVIGSDQVAFLAASVGPATVLGKPGTAENCIAQLEHCSGQTVSFVTAVALVRHADDSRIEFSDHTRVTFRVLDRATIDRYVAAESPFDCAGGFKSEGLGITLCDSIDNVDPTALIGLPLIRLGAALRSVGFDLP